MYENLEIITLIPSERGKGGIKTGFQSMLSTPVLDVRDSVNVAVFQEQWKKESGLPGIYGSPRIGTHVRFLGLTVFARQNSAQPASVPTLEVISHLWRADGLTSVFHNHTTGVDLLARGSEVPVPGVMESIGQRLFYSDGLGPGQIYDGSVNGYTIGVAQPEIPPTLSIEPSGEYSTGIYVGRNGESTIRSAETTGQMASLENGQGVHLNTWNSGGPYPDLDTTVVGDPVIVSSPPVGTPAGRTLTAVEGDTFITLNYALGTDIFGYKVTWYEHTATNGLHFFNALGSRTVKLVTVVGPSTTIDFYGDPITAAEATWAIVPDPLTTEDFRIGWSGTEVTIATPLTFGADENADNPIAADIAGEDWLDGDGPGYAYALYDPVTGHMSNISPIAYVEGAGVNNAVGIEITAYPRNLDGSVPAFSSTTGIQYSGPGYGWEARFTHIVFFRSLRNGGGAALFPIGGLDPEDKTTWRGITNVPPAGPTMWYDISDDKELLVSDILRAPQYTNEWPQSRVDGTLEPARVMHMAYWDGRLWVVGAQEQDTIKYSCDKVQCPFGVPQESFPRENVLRTSANDGLVTGLKVVGNLLVITTRRWAYYVAGNSWDNYRLIRLSVHMSGVGARQLTEVPSETDGQSSVMVFVGRDRVVYVMQPGQPPQAISRPVQDVIDGQILEEINYTHGTVLHYCCIKARNLLVLGLVGRTLVFNLDNQTWERVDFFGWPFQAFASGFGLTNSGSFQPVVELAAYANNSTAGGNVPSGLVMPWLSASDVLVNAWLETFPLWNGSKMRRLIHFIRIYVRQPSSQTWGCSLRLDDNTVALAGTFVAPEATFTMIGPSQPIETGLTELICHVPSMTRSGVAVDNPQACYRAILRIDFPANVLDTRISAIHVGTSPYSEVHP